MGSRLRAQSPSSVKKKKKANDSWRVSPRAPAPQCGYKKRVCANAQFFAEEPGLCVPAVQRWYSNYGDGTLRLRSLLQGTRVTKVTKMFPISQILRNFSVTD